MATHTSSTSSRRHVLTALSGAALAGGALVLAMPPESSAIPIIGANPDAELLALIARFDAIERQIWGGRWPLTFEEEKIRDAANRPLHLEQSALLKRICSMPTHTFEGLRARALSYLAWDDEDCPESCQNDRMVAAILRGLAGEVRA